MQVAPTGRKTGFRRLIFSDQGLRAGWGILVFLVTAFLLVLGAARLMPAIAPRGGPVRLLPSLLSEIDLLVAALGATTLTAWTERRNVLAYGLAPRGRRGDFLAGTFWGVVFAALLGGILIATGSLVVEWTAPLGSPLLHNALGWAVTFFLVAVAEEMVFRGYLLIALSRLVGFWPAAALLSLLFGLAHLTNGGETASGIVSAVVAGLLLSLCVRVTGSLWWGIGFHAAWDWALSFVLGAPISGFGVDGKWLDVVPVGSPLLSGGPAGPEGSLFVLPLLLGVALLVSRRATKPALAVPG